MIRQVLVYLKRQYNTNLFPFARLVAIVLGVSLVVAFVMDYFLPFQGLYNALRSLVLIPLAASIFSMGYLISYYLHNKRVQEDEEWVPYRLRFSLTWRRRISMIVFAFLMVFVYGTMINPTMGYTLSASLVVASCFALLAFLRATREEAMREELGIPDARDVRYDLAMRERRERREAEEREKAAKRKIFKRENPSHDDDE